MPPTRVSALQRAVFDSPRWAFLSVMAVIALVKAGVWFFPNTWMIVQIAQDPFRDPFPADYLGHYQMWTWLTPALAYVLRAQEVWSFTLVNMAASVAFIALVVGVLFRRLPERRARIAVIVFAVLPVSWVSVYGVGPDGLTLLLLTIALIGARHWWIVLGAGVLLGMQHAEQAVVAAAAVIIADAIDRRQGLVDSPITWRFGALLVAGTAVGRLLLAGVFAWSGVGSPSGRQEWIADYAAVLAERAYLGWPWLIWSVLGLGWLLAAFHAAQGRASLSLFVPLALLLLLAPLVYDQTRVLAIVTFPLLYRAWIANPDFLRRLGGRRAAWLAVVWAVVPVIFVLGAEPFGSVLPYSLALLSHGLTGSPALPADLGMWPFG